MRILVVLPRFPYPLEKGDKLRAYHQVRYLSRNHEVYLFCVSHQSVGDEQLRALEPYCKGIKVVHLNRWVCYKNTIRNYFFAKSLQLGYWDSGKSRRAYRAYESEVKPDVVYNQMVRTMPLVARSQVPKVMDFQDALSMNTERRMESTRPGPWRYLLHYEFKMLRSSEYNAFKIFNGLTIISETDSQAVPHTKNGYIDIVPNGVDTEYYSPVDEPKLYDIIFCGNMQYQPNVDAAQFLVNEVLPLVKNAIGPIKVLLAGAEPTFAVRRLTSDDVTVTGWVDDMRKCYAQSKVFVAPMRIGSGLQNKLLEAMSMQLPCITTSLANASLGAIDGSEVLVANDSQTIADAIVNLLSNESQRMALAKAGHEFVLRNYNWDVVGAKLEQILINAANQ
ncbi:MAG: glycosyltransferase [Bacteroidales bacterium]|nr:glycosyltransferase [Bacteroidales bacterium]